MNSCVTTDRSSRKSRCELCTSSAIRGPLSVFCIATFSSLVGLYFRLCVVPQPAAHFPLTVLSEGPTHPRSYKIRSKPFALPLLRAGLPASCSPAHQNHCCAPPEDRAPVVVPSWVARGWPYWTKSSRSMPGGRCGGGATAGAAGGGGGDGSGGRRFTCTKIFSHFTTAGAAAGALGPPSPSPPLSS